MTPTSLDAWTTADRLVGRHCGRCGTYAFPPTAAWCPNPACDGDDLDTVELSPRGRVWSYTSAEYQPPAPYVPVTDPYRPFAIAAVELEKERLIILGQVAEGFGVGDLHIGAEVEVVVEPLDGPDGSREQRVWRWRPSHGGGAR
ncbi:MAG: Zn-ribbon domain-containing OB-fold protein [Acidimicrobiales bacterium]